MNSESMVKVPILILAVLIWFQCNACVAYVVPGNTTPDDERYFDREVRIQFCSVFKNSRPLPFTNCY